MKSDAVKRNRDWVVMTLLISSLSMIFVGSSLAFIYLKYQNQTKLPTLPVLFYINTLVILLTSWIFIRAKGSTVPLNYNQYSQRLQIILGFSVVFLILQVIAWYFLLQKNIDPGDGSSTGFLYLFSFLHLLHVIGGLPFLLFVLRKLLKQSNSHQLITQYDHHYINLLAVYWHFLDILWIYIMLFMLVNSLW
ncbi:MAG: cytochrome c oxidase subunit 3 [Bacteroidota bacterium]|nr:cytochrome c oxidase subunit 3 [Bacteroidota bacterium]